MITSTMLLTWLAVPFVSELIKLGFSRLSKRKGPTVPLVTDQMPKGEIRTSEKSIVINANKIEVNIHFHNH